MHSSHNQESIQNWASCVICWHPGWVDGNIHTHTYMCVCVFAAPGSYMYVCIASFSTRHVISWWVFKWLPSASDWGGDVRSRELRAAISLIIHEREAEEKDGGWLERMKRRKTRQRRLIIDGRKTDAPFTPGALMWCLQIRYPGFKNESRSQFFFAIYLWCLIPLWLLSLNSLLLPSATTV